MKKIAVSLLLIAALLAGIFSGCDAGKFLPKDGGITVPGESGDSCEKASASAEQDPSEPPEEIQAAESAGPEAQPEPEENVPEEGSEEMEQSAGGRRETIIPLSDGSMVLSCWTATLRSLESLTETLNDLEFIQIIEEKTGVHIEWEQASSMGAAETFQLMAASGDYTDMVFDFPNYYTGGVTKALEEEVILDLTDYMEECAPNYSYIVHFDPEILREVLTDDGRYLAVYGCYDYADDGYKPLTGPMIRSDWLDEVNLGVPATYDEYYEMAAAFKNRYGCSQPILMMGDGVFASGYFCGGLGTPGFSSSGSGAATVGLYRDGGVVHSSLLEQGFVDYLSMMNTWYSDGIIGADFFSNPTTNMSDDYKWFIYNDETGVFAGDAVNMTAYGDLAASETFALTGAPDPVSEAGGVSPFGYVRSKVQGHSGVITSSCRHPELALSWLDQWYSEEGFMLGNYGIKGKTYEYNESGLPVYTDLIMNNPDGLPQQMATVYYTNAFVPGLYTQNTRFNMWDDLVLNAVAAWAESTTGENLMPNVSLSVDESSRYAELATDIQTHAAQSIVKFITGDLALADYEDFKDELLDLGLQECIDLYQTALERYETR